MKQVLLLIESHLFREYLNLKLETNGIDVGIANNPMDAVSKMRSLAPDLLILDYEPDPKGIMDMLKQKKLDVNSANTPVIILAQKLEQKQLLELVPYDVKKVFNKPVKVDAFFITLSEILRVPINIDKNPGIVEVHINENIIFVEIAQGLNRDKLDLLRYKISELTNLYKIRLPKVIIMLSDIKLGISDAPNMQKLLNTVIESSNAKPGNIRILTKDDFARQYVNSQKEYSGIKVVTNLQFAMDDLVSGPDKGGQYAEKAELIGDKILKAKNIEEDEDEMALRFQAEERKISFELFNLSVKNLRIAVVDDDFVIQELIKQTFGKTDCQIYTYSDGDEFLASVDTEEFDLAFLDLMMPRVDGFEVLRALQARNISYPVIVLSAISQRDAMIKAIQMGVKSYLVKPLKPEDIFVKSIEILKANF